MNTSTVIIKRVTISSFKNIKNLTFDLVDGENLVIEGRNGLGKSNILNAIYWCLTGYDLNGCPDNELFVPYYDRESKVDVEVTTNVGKIQRTAAREKGTLSTLLFIDNVPFALKDGEIEIDKRLGILPFTFSNTINKDFNLRRFLMNPTYHFGLVPKTIRDIFAKQISKELIKKDVKIDFNPLFLKLIVEENDPAFDTEVPNYYEIIERLTSKFDADTKLLKTQIEKWNVVLTYLKTIQDQLTPETIDHLEYRIKEAQLTLNMIEEKLMVLDSGRQSLNEAMEKVQKGLIRIEFQTTTSKGTKKNAYKVKSTGIELEQCSTSESIEDSFRLIDLWSTSVGCHVSLPIFIDRAESMNSEKIRNLEFGHQVLLTKVTTGRKIKINNWEVK